MCIISAKTDRAFKEFLDARNPTKQHSSTLESYLIKPVQRVLKYPLLLRELVSLTDGDSEEHYHLTGTEMHSPPYVQYTPRSRLTLKQCRCREQILVKRFCAPSSRRGSESHGEGGQPHQRDAEDL